MWDVLYAIDASTSMGEGSTLRGTAGETKVDAVKKGIMQLVSGYRFPFGARIGVMAFRAPTKAMGLMVDSKQEFTQMVLDFVLVSGLRTDMDRLKQALDGIRVGGATPTGEGLKAAIGMLLQPDEKGHKRIKKVVVVTDDKSNFGPKPDAVLDASLIRKAIIDVVAIEKAADSKSFDALVSRSGGKLTVVTDANGLALALDPRIPYVDAFQSNPLLVEAERVAEVLKLTDKRDSSYKGLAAAGAAVRSRLAQKLQDVVSLEGQARADLDLALSAALNDPKWPLMSMREFSDRVWSKGAELSKLQALDDAYRKAIAALPAS